MSETPDRARDDAGRFLPPHGEPRPPETVAVVPSAEVYHRLAHDADPEEPHPDIACRTTVGDDRETKPWPYGRAEAWRDPCQHEECFGGVKDRTEQDCWPPKPTANAGEGDD